MSVTKPRGLEGKHYEAIVIGAGLSGLAAAIRIAIAGKKVLLVERHNAPGGLNSFYSIAGRKYDVGLHALTNFALKAAPGAPLTKILRQLRLRYDDFELREQMTSSIVFNATRLRFSNDIELLKNEIAREFATSSDAFSKLIDVLPAFDSVGSSERSLSARAVLKEYFPKDPLLVEMLLAPVMYYGSATEHDLDWGSFAILFRSIFLEGLSRPVEGIRKILRILAEQYRALGGEKLMQCGIARLEPKAQRINAIVLDNGETVSAERIISSAGYEETLGLCQPLKHDCQQHVQPSSRISFVEMANVLNCTPRDLGWDDTICFYNCGDRFEYACPQEAVDVRSGVICFPNNYQYAPQESLAEGWLKITALANFNEWAKWDEPTYLERKAYWFDQLLSSALQFLPGNITKEKISPYIATHDMFTPRTVKKFTGHIEGGIYGSPQKSYEGLTPYQNLFVCGTDQGLLGITGAMLSGILIANRYVLDSSNSLKM